jgi:hypothetical protein
MKLTQLALTSEDGPQHLRAVSLVRLKNLPTWAKLRLGEL